MSLEVVFNLCSLDLLGSQGGISKHRDFFIFGVPRLRGSVCQSLEKKGETFPGKASPQPSPNKQRFHATNCSLQEPRV